MNKFLIPLLSVIVLACNPPEKYDLVRENVGVFDGERDLGIVNFAINADTIAEISTKPLKGDSVMDGTAKYLIPGMVNSHTHIWSLDSLKTGYHDGILANLNMHTGYELREDTFRLYRDSVGYPMYFGAGLAATVPNGHPTQFSPHMETINDSLSIEQWVDNRIANGSDFIKVIRESHQWFQYPPQPTLGYEQIRRIIDYSHSKGYKVVVHIGRLSEMVEIARLKPDGFVHMWSYKDQSEVTQVKIDIIRRSNAFVIPTAILQPQGFEFTKKQGEEAYQWAKENFLSSKEAIEGVRRMHEAGIMLVAGTDVGAGIGMNYGDDLLRELDLYSEAGLSNIEVLKTATGNAAKAFDIPVGLLQVGRKANMLLLNSNPIDDLDALKDINTIWKNGLTK